VADHVFRDGDSALLAAVLVKLTLTEPRAHSGRAQVAEQQLPGMANVLSTLWHQRSSRHLSLAIILLFTMGLGWRRGMRLYDRSHGMGTAELGVWLA